MTNETSNTKKNYLDTPWPLPFRLQKKESNVQFIQAGESLLYEEASYSSVCAGLKCTCKVQDMDQAYDSVCTYLFDAVTVIYLCMFVLPYLLTTTLLYCDQAPLSWPYHRGNIAFHNFYSENQINPATSLLRLSQFLRQRAPQMSQIP